MPFIIFEKYIRSLCLIMVPAQALYIKLQSALIPSQPMMDDYADRRVLRMTIQLKLDKESREISTLNTSRVEIANIHTLN